MKVRRKDGTMETILPPEPRPAHFPYRGQTRLSPEEREHINSNRNAQGHFLPGVSGFPGGSVRKAREDRYFIDALKDVFEGLGGVPAMLDWARAHPTKFYEIMSKLMPVQLNIDREYGNNTITVKHAFLPKQLSGPNVGQPMEGVEITMVDEANLTPSDVMKAIGRMEQADKDALLAALQAGAAEG